MNTSCELISCRKKLGIRTSVCGTCDNKFCSESCKITHSLDVHRPSTVKRRSTFKSPFMKFGEHVKQINEDPLYDFKNFEFVKTGMINQIIGSGAFGDVLLARNKIDHKLYAIKQMNKNTIIEMCSNLDVVKREIEIHRRLIHENIVRMYSYHEDKDAFYLIMEYVNGGTLFNLIKKSKGLDEKIAFKYFINSAAAINFLHENNMVHRDVKPENLLIDENGVVKLCDFGWCVELGLGARSTFCGTYEYMAPEIINESPYNNSIDVWSLGVLLYELLHGYSPFRAKNNPFSEDNYMEIFRNIVKYNFQIEKEISEHCADLLKKLITPESKQRIKIRDIFFHPWVRSFEAEFKEKRISAYNTLNKCDNKENLLVQNYTLNKQCPLKNIVNKDSKASIKINDNILKDKEKNEFSILDPNKSLFDEVLNQVKNKNSIKKKKGSKNDIILKSVNLSNTAKNKKKDEDKLRKRLQNSMLDELATLQYKLDDILNSTKMNEVSFISSRDNVKTNLDTQIIFSDTHSTEHLHDCNNLSTQSSMRKYERVELNKDDKIKPEEKEQNIITQSTCECGNDLVKRNEGKEMNSRKNSLDISRTVDIQITDKYNYKSNLRSSIYDSQNSNSILGSEGFDKEFDKLNLTVDHTKSKFSERSSLLTAIEILEKAKESNSLESFQNVQKQDKSFWSFMKCGHNN